MEPRPPAEGEPAFRIDRAAGSKDDDRKRDRSRSRSRDRYRDSGRDHDRDRRRDDRYKDEPPRHAERAPTDAPAGPAKTSVRRYFRKGPSGWDVKPAGWVEGMEIPSTLAPPISGGAVGGGIAAPTQQTRHARRIYVGGLEAVPEQEIAELFTAIIRVTMLTPLPDTVSPVLSVYINPERKFAFVEVATIELATALMGLDGMTYKGQPLKIRRPHDYKPEILPADIRDKSEPLNLAMLSAIGVGGGSGGGHYPGGGMGGGATGIGTSGNRDSIYRIFIGGLPSAIDEQQLAELMGAFGAVKHLNIVRGPDGAPKGYGFCEYEDGPGVTDLAVQSLNGMEVAGRTITVTRAKSGPGGGTAAGGAAPLPPGLDPAALAMAMGMTGATSGPTAGQSTGPVSTVACLDNMVAVEELSVEEDYADILLDVSEEAGKYGQVAVTIPRPPAPGSGRVFLRYADAGAAAAAVASFSGRKFGTNVIVARLYDEAAFAAGNLTA